MKNSTHAIVRSDPRLERWVKQAVFAVCLFTTNIAVAAVPDCQGSETIRQLAPVDLDEQQLAEFSELDPLQVHSASAPPLTGYDPQQHTYKGVSVDILCFITQKLGLRYELIPGRDQSITEKLNKVQQGKADIFVPLSHTAERAKHGIFTDAYYDSYYAVIARKQRRLAIQDDRDLAQYRVGIVGGVSLIPVLKELIPPRNLRIYNQLLTSDALFQALRNDDIDVVVFNKDIFIEKRYQHELFDLETIYTLSQYPRSYRFYFSDTPQHQRIVTAFNRYLAVIDVSASIQVHEDGERQIIDRYVAQRSQRTLLQAAMIAALLLALIFYAILRRHRRLSRLLSASNKQVLHQQHTLQQAYQKLEALSLTDPLTGLANRRHFDTLLHDEHSRHERTGFALSLLLIDVDHFKAINDHYGHTTGDRYLVEVADVLKHSAGRSSDVTARHGGEEFACLLPNTDMHEALVVAQRMCDGVAKLDLSSPLPDTPRLTISIGIATLACTGCSAESLLHHADKQLYIAKNAGRDQVRATVITQPD